MHSVAGPAEATKMRRMEADDVWYDDVTEGEPGFADVQRRLLWLLGTIWRGRWIVLAVIAATLVVGVVVTLLTTPLYRSTASVQIDQESDRVLGTEDLEPAAAYQDADRFLQTNVDVLRSRATAIRVAQDLNLFAGTDFIEDMGGKLNVPAGANPEQVRRETVLELLSDNLSVNLPRDSRIVGIGFRSPDPQLSARIANAFADNFITGNLQRKFNSTSYAKSFLEEQLVPARERLETSERQLIGYARQAGLIDTQGTTNGEGQSNPNSVTISNLVELSNARAAATANRIAAQERLRVAQNTPAGALPESYQNQGVQRLYEARADQVARLQDELKRHKEDFPTVIQARAAIAELDQQINALNQDIRRSLTDQFQTARQQEDSLSREVDRMKSAALTEKDLSVQYNTLLRDVDSNRAMYEALLQRFKEVSAASGVAANNLSIVDRADPALEPTSPKLLRNLAIALVLGLLIAIAVVILRELFDDRAQSTADVERKFGIPALGLVPEFEGEAEIDQQLASAHSPVSEAYHSVATAVLLSSARAAPKILMVTSTQSGEGKSSSAIGLASAFGRLGKRALLVECDLRRPSLKDRLDVKADLSSPGLAEYLARQTDRPAILAHDRLRFDHLLAGSTPPDPIELLGSPRLAALLQDLAGRYDQIVLDGPPVLGLADAPILASHSDAVVFVVEAGRPHRGRAKAALSRIRRFDAPVIGTILTKARLSRFGYGYYREYHSYT